MKTPQRCETEIGVYWYLFSNHCTRECIHKKVTPYRTSPRNRNPANPANRTHLDQSLRSSRKNGNSLTWVLVALTVCFTYPVLYRVSAESRAGECESRVIDNENSWSFRADARRRITLRLYYQSQVSLQGTGFEPLGLDPVLLSKIGTRLLASLGSKGKIRNPLACLRNAGSYSAESYCTERKICPSVA